MKKPEIIIEEMQPQDEKRVYNLFVTVMSSTLAGLSKNWTEEKFKEHYATDSFREKIHQHLTPGPDSGLFVAKLSGEEEIVGFAKAGIHDGKHWMDFSVVDERYRGQGIGAALYRRRLVWHDEKDPQQKNDIYLQVAVGNPAWSIHVKHGFTMVNYYQDKDTGLWKETMRLSAARRKMEKS